MQTTNISSEFSSEQCNQLKQLKELLKLLKLQEKCEKFKNELERLSTERRQCLENQEKFTEHLITIQNELNMARNEELNWQTKLEDVKNTNIDDKLENLQKTCAILGYKISNWQLLENIGLQITLQYRDICYVSYSEANQLYDIIEIHPQHHNFPQIQQFLKKSQDLRGLLSCLRKFFDFAIQIKENIKKD